MLRTELHAVLFAALALIGLAVFSPTSAGTALTVIDANGAKHTFPITDLLTHPAAETVAVARDPAYGGTSSTYRAIPLARVLAGLPVSGADILEATALDGYVAQLPAVKGLSTDPDAAVAYLAVEDPARPWPKRPGKEVSAGPYYVVWRNPERSAVGPSAWPFQTVQLKLTGSVAKRFPQIAVPETLPADDPARHGQALFVNTCFSCHKMNGGGEATLGPDLNLPMNPTEYFQASVLPHFLRAPASVRHWPDQKMTSFTPDVLSDNDRDAIIAYLRHMVGRR